MKKIIPYVLILILGFFWLRQCSLTKGLKSEIEILNKVPDTVYKTKEIKIPEPYPVYLPGKVEVYKPDTVKVPYKEIIYLQNTLRLYLPERQDSMMISKWFLLQYPTNHKLIDLDLSRRKLNMDFLTVNGMTLRNSYQIDLEKYNYRFVNNQMTVKKIKRLSLKPEIEYSFRPWNNLHDLTGSLNFKTTRFTYKLGINTFYYPKFDEAVKIDGLICIKYNF